MAAANQKTKWRRLVKKQLFLSNLPIENEMYYRQYVNIIFQVSMFNDLGDDIHKVDRKTLTYHLHKYLAKKSIYPWEQDLILYTSALLMDNTEGKITPPFQGASLFCGECSLPVKINSKGDRYVCAHCNAQVNAGPNRMPLGIPVLQELRKERKRLHNRMDMLMGKLKVYSNVRDQYYRGISDLLNIPYELTHIGLITSRVDVAMWDIALDFIVSSTQTREVS